MPLVMKFIGANGSMGYQTGKCYEIKTTIERNMIFVWPQNSTAKPCPYSNLEKLLENWEICYTNNQQKDVWDDF